MAFAAAILVDVAKTAINPLVHIGVPAWLVLVLVFGGFVLFRVARAVGEFSHLARGAIELLRDAVERYKTDKENEHSLRR